MDGRNEKGQFVKGRKGALEDLTGQRFGRLVVVSRADSISGATIWNCKCDCGKEKKVYATNLKRGVTKSCGCWHDESSKINSRTHGMTNTNIYTTYRNMISRCYNKKSEKYKRYGGRGIKVCDEWKNNFISFYDWAMKNGYKENLSIDRIDNDGNYEPSNCRWVTMNKQANNRRNNHFVNINGQTKTMAEWINSKKYEADKATVYQRIKRGWSDIDAITKPVIKKYRNKRWD